ncbi:hypothetical protein E2562_007286 [Oryza meyeriana var. granulata]|uniref:Uncharacterized protein n=1 Tax=Oryza meyeriana var. granulata TaxID=110450 RepID=A0A6G1CE78_9ORYZ|nr:hypothetical protein E2562_007286 [Oryza meyeriana var. granulata]
MTKECIACHKYIYQLLAAGVFVLLYLGGHRRHSIARFAEKSLSSRNLAMRAVDQMLFFPYFN